MISKIAAAYIRVSTIMQDEYSPDSQLKKIREFAERQGYIIPDEFVFYDDGISGTSVKKRNEFHRMIGLAKEKEHPFEVIYVWKFSRFARNQEESIVYKNLLRKINVNVVSVSEPIPEGPFGTLIERIIEWMDEFYSINLAVEVKRGMTEKVSRGEPICAPAYGYDIKDKEYYPNEEEAVIVQEIFTRYANGESAWQIVKDLNQKGIRTKKGYQLSTKWLNYMITNSVYIGKIRWSSDGTRAISRNDLDNESVMIVDGHHKPLVSMEIWDKVQERNASYKKAYAKYSKSNQPVSVMIKGLVRCSSCGGTLAITGRSGKNKVPFLQCCGYTKGNCKTSHGITSPRLEQAIIDGLKQAIATQQFTIAPEKKAIKKDSTDYAKLISLEERRLERAKTAYLAGIDDIKQYADNKTEIEKRINELKELSTREDATKPTDLGLFATKVQGVVEFIEDSKNTPQAKNKALRTILEKIVYNKPTESVCLFFYE